MTGRPDAQTMQVRGQDELNVQSQSTAIPSSALPRRSSSRRREIEEQQSFMTDAQYAPDIADQALSPPNMSEIMSG